MGWSQEKRQPKRILAATVSFCQICDFLLWASWAQSKGHWAQHQGQGPSTPFFSGTPWILLFASASATITVIKSCLLRGALKKNSLVIFFLFCDLDDFENRYPSYTFMGQTLMQVGMEENPRSSSSFCTYLLRS